MSTTIQDPDWARMRYSLGTRARLPVTRVVWTTTSSSYVFAFPTASVARAERGYTSSRLADGFVGWCVGGASGLGRARGGAGARAA